MEIRQFFLKRDIKGAIAFMRGHEEYKDILPAYVAVFENCQYRTYEVPELVSAGVISGGMIPKMECCVDAIAGGVERVHILDGRIPHSILIELLSDEGIGTMLKKED